MSDPACCGMDPTLQGDRLPAARDNPHLPPLIRRDIHGNDCTRCTRRSLVAGRPAASGAGRSDADRLRPSVPLVICRGTHRAGQHRRGGAGRLRTGPCARCGPPGRGGRHRPCRRRKYRSVLAGRQGARTVGSVCRPVPMRRRPRAHPHQLPPSSRRCAAPVGTGSANGRARRRRTGHAAVEGAGFRAGGRRPRAGRHGASQLCRVGRPPRARPSRRSRS